ncbi:hypothetical protein K1T71_014482 [Dendrolimus kikuchii]|uniref:Uncharacterized protein n=1 Tax=Dendrolimus kikuchii TaxID=765133 RepID=A0ACC1CE79_9NEOP|nr:hypothetical protein K1T71_014482 [Dendrolimus kikuchii]
MADPEPRPPRGANTARKRSRVRPRGPYQDIIDADESATKAAATRQSRSTVERAIGTARAVTIGTALGVHSQGELKNYRSDAEGHPRRGQRRCKGLYNVEEIIVQVVWIFAVEIQGRNFID